MCLYKIELSKPELLDESIFLWNTVSRFCQLKQQLQYPCPGYICPHGTDRMIGKGIYSEVKVLRGHLQLPGHQSLLYSDKVICGGQFITEK